MSSLSSIKYCNIHPAIGIARLGNSPDEYFIGPEVSGNPPNPKDNSFKDKNGFVKRQAVRFRIYGYDSNNKVIKEITSDECHITWNVHLSNRKGETKLFVGRFNQTNSIRNEGVSNRNDLVIDPGPRSLNGPNKSGDEYKLDSGKFMGTSVSLGEIRTDEKGRLIVLGGFGKSASIDPNKYNLRTFANNDGWYDDTSDGPVTASVTLIENGNSIPVQDSSWIIVAPPKFAPYHYPIVTLYETMREVAFEQNWIEKPDKVSFMKDIFPLFFRIVQYKWLNKYAEIGHGKNGPGNILTKFKQLNESGNNGAELRKRIFKVIRNPNLIDQPTSTEAMRQAEPNYMPYLSGDDGDWDNGKFRTWMTVLPSQYENLKRWSQGDFASDFDENILDKIFENNQNLEDLPVEVQPSNLDKVGSRVRYRHSFLSRNRDYIYFKRCYFVQRKTFQNKYQIKTRRHYKIYGHSMAN